VRLVGEIAAGVVVVEQVVVARVDEMHCARFIHEEMRIVPHRGHFRWLLAERLIPVDHARFLADFLRPGEVRNAFRIEDETRGVLVHAVY
jgi:hypothetical protein